MSTDYNYDILNYNSIPRYQNVIPNSDQYKQLYEQDNIFDTSNSPNTGIMGSVTKGLQNEGLMKGIVGAGSLAIGLASYLDQKNMLNQQLKALKQNTRINKERYDQYKTMMNSLNNYKPPTTKGI